MSYVKLVSCWQGDVFYPCSPKNGGCLYISKCYYEYFENMVPELIKIYSGMDQSEDT